MPPGFMRSPPTPHPQGQPAVPDLQAATAATIVGDVPMEQAGDEAGRETKRLKGDGSSKASGGRGAEKLF